MRLSILIVLISIASFSVKGQEFNAALNKELLAMEKADQDARIKCTTGTGDEQIQCLAKIAEAIDAPNTKRLEEIFQTYGFPTAKLVGRDGFSAFMILLQHCNSDPLREKCLKPIEKAFKRKELSPLDCANFTDRLRLHQGKDQVFGSNFDFKDGKLVMSKTIDPKNLDRRRSKIGLPPISEYMKMLKEMYHLEVEVPKIN